MDNKQELSLKKFEQLALEYEIPLIDVILIAINRYGLTSKDTSKNRIRFLINTIYDKNPFFLAVCLNTYDSPFILQNGRIFIDDIEIAWITEKEEDKCDSSYFRKDGKVLTLNSNIRSNCKGCKFCGTFSLKAKDTEPLIDEYSLTHYVEKILVENDMDNFNSMESVSICTGCFNNENELIKHLHLLRTVFSKYGFTKKIGYIGSQLQSADSFDKIKYLIGDFSLHLTVECFSRRKELMHPIKAQVDIKMVEGILKNSFEKGFETNYLYIVGLDSLDDFILYGEKINRYVSNFPQFQILQNFTREQEKYRIKEAINFEYYLKYRDIIESIFSNSILKPQLWENYRGLFYTEYNKKIIQTQRK